MSDAAIRIVNLGKMYKIFRKPSDKLLSGLGLDRLGLIRKDAYTEFWALRGINLRVEKGERVGIIGRNGAGKSTLLKAISGIVSPTEGEVAVNGRVQALMELGTGFHPEFTGRQNIRAALSYQGLTAKRARALEDEVIEFAELDEFIDQPIKTFSAGMYARLAFSVATAIEPEVLIIDEILGAGDAYFAGKCLERMRRLTEESGATVLFVSHDLASVQALCTRVLWLDRGTVCGEGDPLETIKRYWAVVRREEEIRLKARDLRVSKRQAVLLERDIDIYQPVLLRLVGVEGGHPSGTRKVRALSLSAAGQIVGQIHAGAPMDNDPEQKHYLLDDAGYMDWGPSSQDEAGYYRPFGDFGGRYAHAPFQFALPRSYLGGGQAGGVCSVDVVIDKGPGEIAVELYEGGVKGYRRLGTVGPEESAGTFKFSVSPEAEPAATGLPEATAVIHEESTRISVDEYGSKEVFIEAVVLLDKDGLDTRNLVSLEPYRVHLKYNAAAPVRNPVFVFCIYLPSGVCASQWIASGADLGAETVSGRGEVVFIADPLYLGRGSYVASAAIFKSLGRSGVEPEAYHVLDRCVHFQVRDRDEVDYTDYGVCRQPVRVELHEA